MNPLTVLPEALRHPNPVSIAGAVVVLTVCGGVGFVLYGLAQLERMARARKAQDRGAYVAYVESDEPTMGRHSW